MSRPSETPGRSAETACPRTPSFLGPCRGDVRSSRLSGEGVMNAIASLNRAAFAAALLVAMGFAAPVRADRSNPNCPVETVFYDPGNGQDIAVPAGFKVSVFAKDLNFPTGIAFVGNKNDFQVLVVESGKGLPAGNNCNNNDTPAVGGSFSATNPFTPDLTIFDKNGRCLRGRSDFDGRCAQTPAVGKPTSPTSASFQVDGPAI